MPAPRFVISALALSLACGVASAADNYVFDSVSSVDFHQAHPTITGVLRGSSTPITVTFPIPVPTSGSYVQAVAFCMPVILTGLEKQGRYYLHITFDLAAGLTGYLNCGLELRS